LLQFCILPQKLPIMLFDLIQTLSARTELKLELIKGQIVPKESSDPLSEQLIAYILSPDFDFQHLLTIYDMPKTSINHREIIATLNEILAAQLDRTEFGTYINDMVITAKWINTFYIPDITFVLKRNKIYDDNGGLENPISIIEILSPSTEEKDRNQKKEDYQSIESLQEYVLISQDAYKIEQFLRKGKTSWITKIYDQADHTCILTVGVKIKLKELYQQTDLGKNE